VRVLSVDAVHCSAADLAPAVAWLQAGKVVVLPTDTFYGFAVDPRLSAAVAHVFDLKGRQATEALPLVAASRVQVESWCGSLGKLSTRLADVFWPGPLSLVLDAPPVIDAHVHGGRESVAVRVPANVITRTLCECAQRLLTATSANRSGEPAARRVADLGSLGEDDRVFVIDAGPASGGLPSTIVDARGSRPLLVREGAIAWSRVLESIKE
jgi:L-threonylcarbamoyladenylate synthase